jgi:hypothetical protein
MNGPKGGADLCGSALAWPPVKRLVADRLPCSARLYQYSS